MDKLKFEMETSELKISTEYPIKFREQPQTLTITTDHYTIDKIKNAITAIIKDRPTNC